MNALTKSSPDTLPQVDMARLADLASQLSAFVAVQQTAAITLGELFGLYYEKHATKRNKTPENARYFFQRHAAAYADRPVNSFTQRELQDWVDAISETRGSAGAKRAIDMLSAVINWGIKRGYVDLYSNPCKSVERHAPKARTRFMRPQEFARLADALQDEPQFWRDFVWLCLLTAARRGNVRSMRWQDIDFDLAQWHIADTKNGDDLVIVLTQPAITLLRHRKAAAQSGCPWVFPGEGPTGHVIDCKRMWKRICQRAGIDGLRLHDLRRTAASYMAINGASSYQIGKALGHRDPRSTAIYARLDLTSVREQMDKVHERWIVNCLREASSTKPEPARKILAAPRDEIKPQNVDSRIDPRQQVLIEARIITAMQHGATTKKEFYRKLGGTWQVNATELDRILSEMETRGIVDRYRDDSDLRHWQYWRYRLTR